MTSFDEQIDESINDSTKVIGYMLEDGQLIQPVPKKYQRPIIVVDTQHLKQAFEQEYLRRIEEARPDNEGDIIMILDGDDDGLQGAYDEAVRRYNNNLKSLSGDN